MPWPHRRASLTPSFPMLRHPDTLTRPFLSKGKSIMANPLEILIEQVKQNPDPEASAVLLLSGVKSLLDNAIASEKPAALTDLATLLGESRDALAAAIVATPAATPKPHAAPHESHEAHATHAKHTAHGKKDS